MERLTQWFDNGTCRVVGLAAEHEEKHATGELIDLLLDRLAVYEDTGMEPDEINALREFCESHTRTTLAHIYELVQAEKDGRLIILPAPAKHGDPKPECFYNDNACLWCLGMAQTDGDEPAERCKMCWYCENGYAAEEEGRP